MKRAQEATSAEQRHETTSFVGDAALLCQFERCALAFARAPDGILFRQGESARGVFLVRSGQVALTMGPAALTTYAGPGSILGLPSAIGSCAYSLTAAAEPGAEVSFVPLDAFLRLMESQPEISVQVLQVLAREIRAAREAVFNLADGPRTPSKPRARTR